MGFYAIEPSINLRFDNVPDATSYEIRLGGTLTVSTESAITNVLADGEGVKLNRKQRRREAARWRKHNR